MFTQHPMPVTFQTPLPWGQVRNSKLRKAVKWCTTQQQKTGKKSSAAETWMLDERRHGIGWWEWPQIKWQLHKYMLVSPPPPMQHYKGNFRHVSVQDSLAKRTLQPALHYTWLALNTTCAKTSSGLCNTMETISDMSLQDYQTQHTQ